MFRSAFFIKIKNICGFKKKIVSLHAENYCVGNIIIN